MEAAADQLAEDYRSTGDADDLLDEMERRPEPRRIKVGEPESLMGPAWEDPTSRTLTREPEVARTGAATCRWPSSPGPPWPWPP